MLSANDLIWGDSGRIPLTIGAILLGSAALSGTFGGRSPGLRALACWIPIAAAAIAAALLQRADLAVSIIFCTSVAGLSLVQGCVLLIAPDDPTSTAFHRVWPFALPVALMTLLAGFATKLNWTHAAILLCEGGALLLAWMQVSAEAQSADHPREDRSGALNSLLWSGLAILGSIAALAGTLQVSSPLPYSASSIVVLAILGPLLLLPLLFTASSLAYQHTPWEATTAAVGVVLLNLCLLLPAVILIGYCDGSAPLTYPLITWRVDNVVLLLLSFILLPAALQRWRLGRAEGITLIGFYIVYLLMEVVVAIRI
ncbi:MAG: hypothetical protein ABSF29_07890 [Tepidisphaeraceae bacterium]|jgi:Ca2+/Na+ antiporter